MLKLNINLAMKVFALGAAVPIISGIATKIYWYLQMRTGVEGPYFLYYSGSLRTPVLIYLISPVIFMISLLFLRRLSLSSKSLLPKIWCSSLCLGIILFIAFVLRIIMALTADHASPLGSSSDQACYYGNALSIVAGEYSMLFFARGHVGLLWAPLFLLFENNVLAVMILNVVMGTLTVYLVYRILKMVSGKSYLGLIAGGLMAVFPSHVIFCNELLTEIPFTFFMIFALFWLVRFGVMSSLPQYWISRRWILDISLCGINLGICHWIRPLAVLVWMVAVVWLLIIVNRKAGLSLRRSLTAIVVLSAIFYSSILWLMLVNYKFQGVFSPSYMEGRGYIFFAGTREQGRGSDYDHMDRCRDTNKMMYEELSKNYSGPMDPWGHEDVQGFLKKEAWRRIFDSPVKFFSRAATEKMCQLWTKAIRGNNPGEILNSVLISFTVLSAISLFFVCGVEDRFAWLLLLALIIVTACSACHFFLDSFERYRFYCIPWQIIVIVLSMKILSDRLAGTTSLRSD